MEKKKTVKAWAVLDGQVDDELICVQIGDKPEYGVYSSGNGRWVLHENAKILPCTITY